MTKNSDYEVGYKKPPESGKFKPGMSGNSKGRPKKRHDMNSLFKEGLKEIVIIVENGERKSMTKKEALAKRIINEAISGDHKATKQLLPHIFALDAKEKPSDSSDPGFVDAKELLLKKLVPEFYDRSLNKEAQENTDTELNIPISSKVPQEENTAQASYIDEWKPKVW